MRRSIALVLSIAALVLTGCAIHPLPEDVTRDTTYEIVEKIRCEGREALDNISIQLLRKSTDRRTLELADRVAAGELTVIDVFFTPKYARNLRLDKDTEALFRAYTLSAATFDFSFTITEGNDNSVSSNFRMPLVDGLFTLGASAGAKFDRKSKRKFQITNSFYELHKMSRSYCVSIAARIGNIVYPITGKVGLEEVFKTFVSLDSSIGIAPGDANRFSDTLTFTTTISAGVSPKISVDPVADRRFRLADASASIAASRVDEHEVTIALARGDFLKSLDQARLSAKTKSRIIADQRRVEDFFIVPRDKVLFIQ